VRTFIVIVLALCAAALAARADSGLVSRPDQAAIHLVIQNQIEAFKRDDGAAAFAFAAPRLRAIFADPENFMRMVRSDYQPVYRPSHYAFRGLEMIDGKLIQPVFVIGPSGVPVTALYIMERQADGSWRIGGVVLVPEPGSDA
jgi:hypothetical protein